MATSDTTTTAPFMLQWADRHDHPDKVAGFTWSDPHQGLVQKNAASLRTTKIFSYTNGTPEEQIDDTSDDGND